MFGEKFDLFLFKIGCLALLIWFVLVSIKCFLT